MFSPLSYKNIFSLQNLEISTRVLVELHYCLTGWLEDNLMSNQSIKPSEKMVKLDGILELRKWYDACHGPLLKPQKNSPG
jgi:hypothetical protein